MAFVFEAHLCRTTTYTLPLLHVSMTAIHHDGPFLASTFH
jgi:hypothetical protein